MRIGQGYDLHALVPGRALILGGVTIEYELGLLGHSDADVLTHAVADACLGAAGLGDIGQHFPDSDARYRGADSITLLAEVAKRCAEKGFKLHNADATIIAQAPKLAPYLEQMQCNIAHALGAGEAQVNVKATTTERLGVIGEKKAMAAMAVVLMANGSDD